MCVFKCVHVYRHNPFTSIRHEAHTHTLQLTYKQQSSDYNKIADVYIYEPLVFFSRFSLMSRTQLDPFAIDTETSVCMNWIVIMIYIMHSHNILLSHNNLLSHVWTFLPDGRPDMTFAVNWTLKSSYRSMYEMAPFPLQRWRVTAAHRLFKGKQLVSNECSHITVVSGDTCYHKS